MSTEEVKNSPKLAMEKGIIGENGDSSDDRRKLNKYACASVMAASIISGLYGYVYGVMAGALLFIKEDLEISDVKVQFLVGMLHISALPTCMVAGRTCDFIGRRHTIILTSVTFVIGSALMGYGPSFPILMIGTCISGIAMGFALIAVPIYCAEISPPSYRGSLTSLPEFCLNIGLLLAYVLNYFLGKLPLKLGWRLMLAVPAIPSLVLVFLMLRLVESPRWLVMQGRVGDARRVLLLISNTEEEVEQRLNEIKCVVGIIDDVDDINSTKEIVHVAKKTRSGEGALKELFCKPTPHIRRIFIAAIGLHAFLQLNGISVILLFSPRIFERVGMNDKGKLLLATIGMGVIKLVFSIISTFLCDRVGRRILLLVSSGVMAMSMLGLGICLTIVENYKENSDNLMWAIVLTIIANYAYVAFTSIGVGPVTWVYSSEILPLRLRAQGLSVCVAVNRIASATVVTSFISIYKTITMGGSFFLLTGINALAWSFYYTFLPETKGRSLEDMEIIFGKTPKS